MQKQAPTVGRVLVMVVFALSCFGLLLFLWLSFGGSVPFKPAGYRFKVAFPQAVQLADQSDVRIAGISVGKVVNQQISPSNPNREIATIELASQYAPIRTNARAILREKTLLGETYVELTPGTRPAPILRDNSSLPNSQVQNNQYLDQVLQAFDPATRAAFQNWQQDLAAGVTNQGQNLNDAFGNLPPFLENVNPVLVVLNSQSAAVRQLVRNTGVVFQALNKSTVQLHNVVVNAGQVFQATSNESKSLEHIFKDFPKFQDESKATLIRLETFAKNTDPLTKDLIPVAKQLEPTLTDVKRFAPYLKNTFENLNPLITASQTGLPALRDILNGATPLLGSLDPFLEQLNPILQFLEVYQGQTAMFLGNPGSGLAATTAVSSPDQVGHYLRQFGPVGPESLSVYRQRDAANRGNAYLGPASLQGSLITKNLIFPNFDCIPSGGEKAPTSGPTGTPGCTVDPPFQFQGSSQKYPHIQPDNYNP